MKAEAIAVIGAGSWGITLANLYAEEGRSVTLYTRSTEKAQRLCRERLSEKPFVKSLSANLRFSSDFSSLPELSANPVLLLACTSQTMRDVAEQLSSLKNISSCTLVSVVKGLEMESHKRMSEILGEYFAGEQVAVLSGPNLAHEVLSGLPTASVVASSRLSLAKSLQEILSARLFRVYANDDLVGVELGGTLKNVIAIAAGACDGLNLGINAKASLLTRGLAEMARFAVARGARRETLSGLAGMGDLFATCAGPLSRNYRVGFQLAQNQKLEEVLNSLGAVAEGVTTTYALCELSQRLKLELPIARQVEATLKGQSSCSAAIMALLSRPLANELS
jgi:glycerol-3-phosphate dehydrogenase (NAD(P)+)